MNSNMHRRLVIRTVIALLLTVVLFTSLPQYLLIESILSNSDYSWGPCMENIYKTPDNWSNWYNKKDSEWEIEHHSHFGVSFDAPAPLYKENIYKRWGDNCWVWYGGVNETSYAVFLVCPTDINSYHDFSEYLTNTNDSEEWIFTTPISSRGLSILGIQKGFGVVNSVYEYEHMMINLLPDDGLVIGSGAARAYAHCIIEKSYHMMPVFEFDNYDVKGFVYDFPLSDQMNNGDTYQSTLNFYREDDLNNDYMMYIYTVDKDVMCSIIDSISSEDK